MADDWGKADDWGAAPAQDDWSVAPETLGDEQPSSEAAKEEEEKPQSEPDSKGNNDAKPPRKREKASEGGKEKVEREPYINPDRVATGGQQRTKLTSDELAERMEKIRLKNAQIKERREKIEADKEAFSKLVQADSARAKKQAQVQAVVNSTRDENARIKLERQGNRAWDAEKKVQKERPAGARGRGSKRGRGRGRGGGQDSPPSSHPFQEDSLAATVPGNDDTTEEQWGGADEWGSTPAADDWSKGPVEQAGAEEKSDLPADDEWATGNTEDWA